MDFIGRSMELKFLNDTYRSERSGLCAVYGRHKVGKSALMKKFCEDKRHVLLSCKGGTLSRIFDSFSSDLDALVSNCGDIEDTQGLMDVFAKLKSKKKTVIVLDDYQELVGLDTEFNQYLADFADKRIHTLNLMIILCSSSVKDMMNYIDDRSEPLNGRFLLDLKIRPLPYRDARNFHPEMDEADRIRMYCIAGGVPAYHLMLSEPTSKDNITKFILGTNAVFQYAMQCRTSEILPSQSSYRIMSVLSDGPASLKELSEETGFTGAAIMKTMDTLTQMDIVRKERPVGGKKDPIYRMIDGPLLFYHRIIRPNAVIAEDEDTELSYMLLEEEMEMTYRPMFEDICKQHILRNYYCLEFGRWWNRYTDSGGETVQEDVDIIAKVLVNNEESTLLCECGFFDRPTDMNDLYSLKDKRERIRDIGNVRYMMFSRSGFTNDLIEYAQTYPSERIELIGIDKLY